MQQSLKDTLHGSSETARLFIDLASTNIDVQDMQYKNENVNVIEDIPRFTGKESELEFSLPTFYIHNMNACLSLWTGDAENYMFDINSEMCLVDVLNGPEISGQWIPCWESGWL